MNLKHIRVFLTVYQEESITKAARCLGMTQPATSLAIKELETHYATRLFRRKGRGIQATPAAIQLYPFAHKLLVQYDEMEQQLKHLNNPDRFRIGACSNITSTLIPKLITIFSNAFPDSKPYVSIDHSEILQQQILNGQLDLALVESPISSDYFEKTHFLHENILPVCCPSHPFSVAKNVAIKDLTHETILFPAKSTGIRKQLDSFFKKVPLEPTWESTDTFALINAISSGVGISFLPESLLHSPLYKYSLSTFSITDFNLTCEYFLIYEKEKVISPVIQGFIDSLLFSLPL